MGTKTARVPEDMLDAVKEALVVRYARRLEPVMENHGGVSVVAGFRDENFVKTCGVAMSRVTELSLIGAGLVLLHEAIKRGDKLQWDDIPAK